MSDKFEFYDLLGILVPGSILLALIALSFPEITSAFANVGFPDAFAVICLTAAAVFAGQLVQAISSLLEPVLNWTWGGRSSERALRGELPSRYFPNDTAERIRAKLIRAVGSGASERSLFLYAMQIAETMYQLARGKIQWTICVSSSTHHTAFPRARVAHRCDTLGLCRGMANSQQDHSDNDRCSAAHDRLASCEAARFVKLIECRRSSDGVEAVVCDLEIELAQRPVNAIAPLERVAMLFRPANDTYPDVVSLRTDFPEVIHLNARPSGRPKSFCLYLEPYDELQLHWTPHLFVERVRSWLAKTADGSLHPEDQGLEPLIFLPFGTLVVPGDLLSAKEAPLQLYVVRAIDAEKRSVWIAEPGKSGDAPKREFVAACFDCAPQTHGVIRSAPEDLAQLNQFLMRTRLDIVAEVRALVAEWKKSKLFREVESAKLFLILRLPKRRVEGGDVEIIDRMAFLCDCTLKDVDQRLEIFEVTHDYTGMIAIPESVATQANIPLFAVRCDRGVFASACGGTQRYRS